MNSTLEQVGDLVGVGKSTVRKMETGDIENMKRDKIVKLAKALRVSPIYYGNRRGTISTRNPTSQKIPVVSKEGQYLQKFQAYLSIVKKT